MQRFLNCFRRMRQTKPASANRPRTFRPQLEQLNERLVPSTLSSAISIEHYEVIGNSAIHWTERDWYTVDLATRQVVEFQGTSRLNLGDPAKKFGLGVPVNFFAVSASVDPYTGHAEVFALASNYGGLWLFTSPGTPGTWRWIGTDAYAEISATPAAGAYAGHVYAVTANYQDVRYVDSNGSSIDLGAPNSSGGTGIAYGYATIAASVDASGHNEVFAIGLDHAIYVNSANAYGQWRLVDNQTLFASLSATANDTVFALTSGLPDGGGGQLYQETEHFDSIYNYASTYWTGQYIGGGRIFYSISADVDAYGRDEVYGIDVHADAYLYNQGSWTWKDSDVYDIAGAGGGYFYDVNYAGGNYYGYQWNPSVGWKYLGYGLN